MFPLIISVEEIKQLKRYFEEIKTSNMKIGVMIETPAAVQIGTNDLTQFTLAVDRGEDEVQYLYNELNPAVYSQIKKVIRVCKKYNVETSICGQAGSKPEMVEKLFQWGIDSISVNADAALKVSELIKKMEERGVQQYNLNKEIKSKAEQINNVQVQQNNQSQRKRKNSRIINCAKCGKETRLPFIPRKNKEYFCKNCYFSLKQNNFSKLPELPDEKEEPVTIQDIKENQKELKQEIEKTMLNPENVKIPAEIEEKYEDKKSLQESIGKIEPINNLKNVDEKAEDILEDIKDFNEKRIKENEEIEEKIETQGEKFSRETSEENEGEKNEEILPLDEEDYKTEENNYEDRYNNKNNNEYFGFGDEYKEF